MGEAGSQLIFLGLLLAIFYFMLIRPQKRRVQAHQALVRSIDVGDEVITAGGILGTVKALREDELEVEIAPGTVIRILKTSISRKLTEDQPEDVEEEAGAPDEDAG
jgi:preprotein translocase subunit YajC